MVRLVDNGRFVRIGTKFVALGRLARFGLSMASAHRADKVGDGDVVVVHLGTGRGRRHHSIKFGDPVFWPYGDVPDAYPTQAAIIEGANHLSDVTIDQIDRMHAAAQGLAAQVTAHAEAVERRGGEIDQMLAQIRSIRPAHHAD